MRTDVQENKNSGSICQRQQRLTGKLPVETCPLVLNRSLAVDSSSASQSLLQLQRTYGNRYVQRLIHLSRQSNAHKTHSIRCGVNNTVSEAANKKTAEILLATENEDASTSQNGAPQNEFGLPEELLAQAELLEETPGEKRWRAQDLERIGKLATQHISASQLASTASQLGIPREPRAVHEQAESGSVPGTIQRDAAAAAATAGTMWWLTLVDGPLPVGDLIYAGLIIAAAVAVTTTVSRSARQCRCTIRYAPPDIMSQCPPRVYGVGLAMHDCQNNAKFTAPQQCRRYYGHCGWLP